MSERASTKGRDDELASASHPHELPGVDDLIDGAMEAFWNAEGGNLAGVRAALEFALAGHGEPARQGLKEAQGYAQSAAAGWEFESARLKSAEAEIERLSKLVVGIRECPQKPWHDIATAPKDGGSILLFCPQGDGNPGSEFRVTVGSWSVDEGGTTEHRDLDGRWIGQDDRDYWEGWISWDGGFSEDTMMPTHWMPMPKPPSALENGPAGLADATLNPPLSDLSSLRKGAEDMREALRKIAFLRPAGPTRNKLAMQMERIAIDALGGPGEAARSALVSGSREEQS